MLGTPGSAAKLLLKTIYGIFEHGAHQRRFCITSGEAGSSIERLVREHVLPGPPFGDRLTVSGHGPQ
jgi:hypothetical protein